MAKKDKAAKPDTKGSKAKAADKDEEADSAPEFKYGVGDIAEALDLKPASVRVQLRNKGIEKAGKSYGWNTKSELKEVIEQLKASKPAADDEDDEKPAKKAKKADKAEKPSKKDKKADKPKKSKKAKADEEDDEDD